MFNSIDHSQQNNWRSQLDQFAKAHQQELAALSWGLFLERGNTDDTLGIDLEAKPPKFVYCPKAAIEKLNSRVESRLQEVLGLIERHNPEQEVLIIGIGKSQIKLIHFEPDPPPPICFEQLGTNVDTLMEKLEQHLAEGIINLE